MPEHTGSVKAEKNGADRHGLNDITFFHADNINHNQKLCQGNIEMPTWDGQERRREVHVVCAKENDWGELKATLRGILEAQHRMEENQVAVLKKIFGNGNEGLDKLTDRNKNSISRIWWWLGAISVGFVLSAITVIVEHFKGKL